MRGNRRLGGVSARNHNDGHGTIVQEHRRYLQEKDFRILAARSHSLSRVAGQKSSRAMRDVVDSLCSGWGRLSTEVVLRLDLVEVTLALDFLLSHEGSRDEKRCIVR